MKKIVLLGSGELGKEFVIAAQRLGQYVIAVDNYEGAPAMQVAHEFEVINMLDGDALDAVIAKHKPDFIVPEIEAIRTERFYDYEKQGYTVVQNVISRDKSISMRAKGLYLIIQSYITMPDKRWLKSEFMKMVPEGEKSFNGAWNELKLKGYLKCQIHVDGNKFVREYELLDEPDFGPHTFHYNAKGELT